MDSEPYRTDFRRDFQRLIHSTAFRRLQGKTQLFPSEESDFYRTRLTHSIEVAQIAKSIAVRLNNTDEYFKKFNIDTDLVEFSALAHDLGHPPFGHNGEYILDELMADDGGFEGNAQTLRILTCLEKKVTTLPAPIGPVSEGKDARRGIDPTFRSLASVLKYDRVIPHTKAVRAKDGRLKEPVKGYYEEERSIVDELKEKLRGQHPLSKKFKTIECSIMDVADDIAYSTYDLEDAFAAKFLNPLSIIALDDGIKESIREHIVSRTVGEFSDLPESEREFTLDHMTATLGAIFSGILELEEEKVFRKWDSVPDATSTIGGQVHRASALLAESAYARTAFTSDLIGIFIQSIEVVRTGDEPAFWQVRPEIGAYFAIETLKSICYTQLIRSHKFLADRTRAKFILHRLFEALQNSGSDLLPKDWRAVYAVYRDDPRGRKRTICDFVAGMTNRHCIDYYERLYGTVPPSIHKP